MSSSLAASLSQSGTKWLRHLNAPESARFRVICFPHAGGSASFFRPLGQACPSDLDVWAIQYPGRQDRLREPLVGSIEALAGAIAPFIGDGPSDIPTVCFGHSMGALVAYETVRLLPAGPAGPVLLVVSATPSPAHPIQPIDISSTRSILRELATLDGTDKSLLADREMLMMALPALKSDFQALNGYRWREGSSLDIPIIAFAGDDDPRVSLEMMQTWKKFTTRWFHDRLFPGGHFYLARDPQPVAAALYDGVISATS